MSENEEVALHIYLQDPRGRAARVRLETADGPTALNLLNAIFTTLKLHGFEVVDWDVFRYGGGKNE